MLALPNRAHLPPSVWTDEKVARLKEMHAAGDSYSAISTDIGISRAAVSGKVHRLGLDKRARPTGNGTSDGGALVRRLNGKSGHADRSAKQRIAKKLRVRSEANGGAQLVECVVHDEPPQPAEFLGIAFLDLAEDQCKFPRGEGADIRFCGQPRMTGEPYCARCCRIAFTYTPPPSRRPYLPTGGSKLRVV